MSRPAAKAKGHSAHASTQHALVTRSPAKKSKDMDPAQLLEKVQELEKYKREEEREKKKEELQKRKMIITAKRRLKKEVEHTKHDVKKQDMETARCNRAVNHVMKVEEGITSKKAKAVEKFDEGLTKAQAKHNTGSAALQKKMEAAGTARGKLLHLEFAARMLETGFIVPTGPDAIEDGKKKKALTNGDSQFQDALMDELAVLRDETDALQQEHEQLLIELQESRQQLTEARRSTDAVISSPPPPPPALESTATKTAHEWHPEVRRVQLVDAAHYGGGIDPLTGARFDPFHVNTGPGTVYAQPQYAYGGQVGYPNSGRILSPGGAYGAYPSGGVVAYPPGATYAGAAAPGAPYAMPAGTTAYARQASPNTLYRAASPGPGMSYGAPSQASYPFDQAGVSVRYVSADEYAPAAAEERAAPVSAAAPAPAAGAEPAEAGPGARAFFKAAHSLTAQALREYREHHRQELMA